MNRLQSISSLVFVLATAGAHFADAAAACMYEVASHPLTVSPVDQQIAAALREVSVEKIKANIEALVGFKNRNTISSTERDLSAGHGVLAAADWLKSQLGGYSQACGGCLEVKEDSFVEQPLAGVAAYRSRIAQTDANSNVYAVLHGTHPVASKRMYLVTGHYDTRETDVMNIHDPAPGANDDASGTAVSLEAARVLSRTQVSGHAGVCLRRGGRARIERGRSPGKTGEGARLATGRCIEQRHCGRRYDAWGLTAG